MKGSTPEIWAICCFWITNTSAHITKRQGAQSHSPVFRNLAPYLKRCLRKGSQNKPAEGEAAYLAKRRQNRFFLCSPCSPSFPSPPVWRSLPDTHCPGVNLSSLKAAVFIQSFLWHCLRFNLPRMQAISFPSSLHIFKHCSFRTTSPEDVRLLSRLRTVCPTCCRWVTVQPWLQT